MRSNLHMRVRLNFYLVFLLLLTSGSTLYAQTDESLLFRDDFERDQLGSFWQADASWSIVNGSAFNFIDGTGGTLKTTTDYSEPSYIIETTASGLVSGYYREYRITFGQSNLENDELYELKYTAYFGGRLTLGKSTDNVYYPEVLDEVAVYPGLFSYKSYKFKIAKYESGLIQVYMDEGFGYSATPVLEAIDTTYKTLGHVGWQVDTQTSAEDFYVDWISASKPGVEKPAVKEKPAEDDLIKQVTTESKRAYNVAKLEPGVRQLIDRDYTITSVPAYLNGASFIQTANDDKLNTAEDFLTFFVKKASIVYVAYDSRSEAIPEWLSSWYKTGDRIETSDEKEGHLDVYSKLVDGFDIYPFPTILGGNLARPALGAKTHYLVAAIEKPAGVQLQAEDALLSGAVVAKDHLNYNGTGFADFKNPSDDFIEWTVQIDVPGTYNLGFKFALAVPGERVLQLTDNGVDAGTATFSLPSGSISSWSSWSFLSGPDLFLTAGIHKIRATATGTSGPNIDELGLSLQSASSVAATPIALSGRNLPVNREISGALPDLSLKAYPNPFFQRTNIYFSLKAKTHVNLSVYNLQGQQVQSLISGTREAGNYQATFNADKFAKGIYFYKLQVGNNVRTGKLVKE